MKNILPFSYDSFVRRAQNIDVIWFNDRKMPTSFFEIEHSTDIYNSLLKFSDLRDFYSTFLQENMFIALVAKTDLDLVALEKGQLAEDHAVKLLIRTMEAYTNGGLILIKDKMDENPNYFLQPTSFLNMILEAASAQG